MLALSCHRWVIGPVLLSGMSVHCFPPSLSRRPYILSLSLSLSIVLQEEEEEEEEADQLIQRRYPPGISESPPSPDEILPPVINEWETSIATVKSRHLRGRPCWYLNLMGRMPGRVERSVARALIDPYLARARAQRVPAWLESTNLHATEVYAHLGFRLVEVFRMGVGKVDAQGREGKESDEKKEGIAVFAMIVEPPEKEEGLDKER